MGRVVAKKEVIEDFKKKFSVKTNGTLDSMTINFEGSEIGTVSRKGLLVLAKYLLNYETESKGYNSETVKVNAFAQEYYEMVRTMSPSIKRSFDISSDNFKLFKKAWSIADQLDDDRDTSKLYLDIVFIMNSRITGSPFPSVKQLSSDFTTDSILKLLHFFGNKIPANLDEVVDYFENNYKRISGVEKIDKKIDKPVDNGKTYTKPIFISELDRETKLKDNARYVELFSKVKKGTANIYETDYVMNIIEIRKGSKFDVPVWVLEHREKLEKQSKKNVG